MSPPSIRQMEEALFLVAPHHQGGHSEAGSRVAAALGVDWPFTMSSLAARAEQRGFSRTALWPWCYAPRRAALAKALPPNPAEDAA